MAETPLAAKLRIGPGSRVLALNAPPGYRERLEPLPEGAKLIEAAEGACDVVHLFVRDSEQLERGVLWISYPKRGAGVDTDLTRDVGWETVKGAGLRPVSQVSVDDRWSALRFRPADQVSS